MLKVGSLIVYTTLFTGFKYIPNGGGASFLPPSTAD